MADRHGGESVEGNSAASSRLFFGLSAQAVMPYLLPGYFVTMLSFLFLSSARAAGVPGAYAGQTVWFVVSAALAGAAWAARKTEHPVERRFWGFVLATAAFMMAGQVTYSVEAALRQATPPLASISTLLDAASVVTLVAMLVSLMRFRKTMIAARARYTVDIIAACVVAVALLDDLVVQRLYASEHSGSTLAGIVYSFFPVVGVLLLAGTAWVLIGANSDRWQPWERLIGAASGVVACALIASPVALSESAKELTSGWSGVAMDAVFLSGLYLAFCAAVRRLAEHDRLWRLRPLAAIEPSYGWFASVVLPSIELVAIPAFGISAFATTDPAERMFRLVVVSVVAFLLALRTLLAVADSEALIDKADTDPLTGLLNHRLFYERLEQEIDHSERHGEQLGLIALDIDDFGSVNSVGGHLAGDSAIVGVGRAVTGAVRAQDMVCRVGGDELMVVLPGADATIALQTARRVLDAIREVPDSAGRTLTASAGIACYPKNASRRDELVGRADAALYWAKRHGKDRAVVFDARVVGPVSAQERIRDVREHANQDAVRALAAAVDARDPGTRDHSRNVAALATMLATEMGLDERTVGSIGAAGLLHDVGKVGIADAVLYKSNPLTEEERDVLLQHGPLGAEILSATAMTEIIPWIRHHHERWDGTGTPDGLAGEEIPLGARIIALCEAYDSLVTGRCGRQPITARAARQEIDLDLGVKFDPVMGEIFIGLTTWSESEQIPQGDPS